MKLSNQRLLNSLNTLSKLNQLELPLKVAFLVLKNTKEIEKELVTYFDARQKLIVKYAVLDENGKAIPDEYGNLQFKDECTSKWNADIGELVEIEINVELQKISLDEFLQSELSISPSELATIDFMIGD